MNVLPAVQTYVSAYKNQTLPPTVDIYNPWGKVAPNVNPNYLYNARKADREEAFRKIFGTKKNQYSTHKLETVRFFSFKWWE